MTKDQKIQRYNELNGDIFKINTKRKRSDKDINKMMKLQDEQDELCKDPEVMEYIYATMKR